MAEIVQRNCESMIRELECLRQTKLFSDVEIRRILKVRRHLESRVCNRSKSLDDYKDYIKNEYTILKKIRIRRRAQKVSEKKRWLENRIIFRIKRLYDTALHRYRSNYSLYVEAFKFCKQNQLTTAASQIVENILKLFSTLPKAWCLAAEWYRHQKNFKRAVQTLQKGLTINPQSIMLYNKAIKFEIDRLTESEEEDKSNLELKCADYIKIYVQLILKNITSIEEISTTLDILCSQTYTSSSVQLLLEHLVQNYTKEAIVLLARRERKDGLDCAECLRAAFKKAHQDECLEEKLYTIWLDMLSEEEAERVIEEASKIFNSVEFWKTHITYRINRGHNVKDLFNRGILALKEKALPLWLIMLKHLNSEGKYDELCEYFEQGVKQPVEISNVLKPRYIQIIEFYKGIHSTRTKYRTLALEKPYCRDLHTAMGKLETSQKEIDYENLQKVCELACNQFGKEDNKVWLDELKSLCTRKL